MPLYEYKCRRCNKISRFFEKMNEVGREPRLFWKKKKCTHCGYRGMERIYSGFFSKKSESMADTLNEMSKLGPINFVPRPPSMPGPPPGGCPYCTPENKATTTQKK